MSPGFNKLDTQNTEPFYERKTDEMSELNVLGYIIIFNEIFAKIIFTDARKSP